MEEADPNDPQPLPPPQPACKTATRPRFRLSSLIRPGEQSPADSYPDMAYQPPASEQSNSTTDSAASPEPRSPELSPEPSSPSRPPPIGRGLLVVAVGGGGPPPIVGEVVEESDSLQYPL